jgi:hypothetical protein
LELIHFGWDEEMMNSLVQGLEACQTIANLTVREGLLLFRGGDFDRAPAFGRSLRKCHSIRQLHIIDCPLSSCIAASALMSTESDDANATGGMGSSLQVLQVRDKYDLRDIKDVLKPLTMPSSHLLKLTLEGLIEDVCSQLAEFLPDFHLLRELNIQFRIKLWSRMDHGSISHSFLHALSRNGSLHRASVSQSAENGASAPMLVGLDCRRMQAFCDRNRLVLGMMQENVQTPVSLLPSLCKSVTQSLRMAPTFLLAGVLATGDAVGYIARQKWVRCPDN